VLETRSAGQAPKVGGLALVLPAWGGRGGGRFSRTRALGTGFNAPWGQALVQEQGVTAVASVFVAQAAGIQLTISQQLVIMLTLMLTSKGMAGIPRASQVILAGTLVSFDLPLEGVLLIIGVDELMDMARTTVNLIGNCLATAVVARWEGLFPPDSQGNPSNAR
ncbi:MAG: dicarboxylate/amino acid:cation symporter, partial [Verrucomicrobiota bacterium]